MPRPARAIAHRDPMLAKVHIAAKELGLDEVPSGDIVVHCAVGLRGYLATRVLEQHRDGRGWGRIRNLDGGMRTWLAGISS